MFERFGRFGTLDELNAKAEELFNASDMSGLLFLASENGLPKELAEAYAAGETPYFADVKLMAAGRIKIEADDMGAEEIMEDWADYIITLAEGSEKFASQVIGKGKSFIGCVGALAAYSVVHAENVPKEVIKAMEKAVTDEQLKKIGLQRQHLQYTKIGMPGMGTAKRLIRQYYGGK